MPANYSQPSHSRRELVGAIGIAASVAIAGCADEEIDGEDPDEADPDPGLDDDHLTLTLATEPQGLDPHDHEHTETDIVARHFYEKILDRDAGGQIVGGIAEDWERIEPGHVRFHLRDETITFHDGEELTAEDVAYSLNRVVDDDVGIPSPQRTFISGVESAEVAEDGDAVDAFSPGLNPAVFDNIAAVGGQVVQQNWMEESASEQINTDANGTGPYEVIEYEEDVEVRLTAYDGYWGAQPDAQELTITWTEEASSRVSQLLNEETDIAVNIPPEDVPRVEESDVAYIETVPSQRSIFCPMNTLVEPFSSTEFRQALNYAFDQERMIEDILSGFADPISQPSLEGAVGYNPDVDPYPHDPELAEELIDESGQAGAEITLHTPVDRYLRDVEVAQAIVNDIDNLSNVNCELEQRDFGALVDEAFDADAETAPDFWLIGWGNTAFHPTFIVEPYLTPDSITQQYVDDEEGNELFDDARTEPDDSRREELFQELNAHYHEQAPWLFSHQQYSVYGLNNRIDWEARSDEVVPSQEMDL